MRNLLASIAALVLVAVTPGRATAQTYTYTTIAVPGARVTTANGINDRGQIVGDYTVGTNATHGFLRSNGGFTTIDVPGADTTRAQGINNLGQIVGTYTVGARRLAFLLTGGRFIGLIPPGAVESWTYGVNDFGQVVGGYIIGTAAHNFLWTHGRFVDIDVPGAPAVSTERLGINRWGVVVGSVGDATDPGVRRGFRLEPDGKLVTFQRPGNRITIFNAINDRGDIAGASSSAQPLAQNGTILSFGQFTNFSVQSSSSPVPAITRPYAINNRGQLVGVHTFDSTEVPSLAFVATPAGLEEDVSASPSPSGTRVPLAAIIVDRELATWTLGPGGEILRGGVLAANGYGSQILYYQDEVYVLGDDDNWWRWISGTWVFVGPNEPT